MPRTDCHGDPLPEGAVARIGTIRWRHPGASFVAYTPDGKLLVSVSSRDVRIWDVGTGRQIRRITTEGQRTSTRCATLSRDGTLLAFTVDAEAIVLIDLKTGTECRRIKTSGLSLISVALSADARLLAARGLGESTVLLWDTTTGKRLADVREPSVEEQTYFGGILWPEHSVAFAPDGKRVAASGEPKVACCWDTATGKIVWQAKAGQPRPKSLAFSPDGTLVAWEHDENRIILANAATGKEERSLKADGSPQFLTFSPDGKLLAAACNDSAVRLWDVATGKALRALEGDLYAVNVVAFSPDGKTLTAPVYGCLRHWEVATGKERSDPGGLQGPLWAMAVSPDGALLVTADVMLGVRLWETATGKPAGKPLDEPAVIESPVISPDGKILAFWSGGREVLRLRDLTTGRDRALGGDFGPLAFLPDGRLVAAGPREAAVWDPARGKPLRRVAVPGDEDRNIDVILAGAGGAVASFHEAGAQVREILTDRLFPECRVTAGRVTEAALSRDHRMIALRVAAVKTTRQGRTVIDESKPAVISVREVATGRERCRLAGIATEAGRPTFGPDGQLLALAHGDRICVWHVPTAKEVARLKGHDGAVFALAFSADSRRLISSSTDTTTLVWDLAPLRQGLPRPAELTAHQRDAI